MKDQKPAYKKIGEGQQLKVAEINPEENSFTAELPISADSRKAYVLTYTADIIKRETDGYGNSVRFDAEQKIIVLRGPAEAAGAAEELPRAKRGFPSQRRIVRIGRRLQV